MEYRHHVYSDAAGLYVSPGDPRLVQPIYPGLAGVEHAGYGLLSASAGAGLEHGRPEIFNSDQGCQFTSDVFAAKLKAAGVRIRMEKRGRVFDNIFVERLWRTVKHEGIYLSEYGVVPDLEGDLTKYFLVYNQERPQRWATAPRNRSILEESQRPKFYV